MAQGSYSLVLSLVLRIGLAFIACFAATGFAAQSAQAPTHAPTDAPKKTPTDAPQMALPQVVVTTNLGAFTLELYPAKAPATVTNFLTLVDADFYDGLTFHRVAPNFVVQAGGYDAQLNYRDPPTTVINESFNGLKNRKDSAAMARLQDPDSADSQFFINVKDNGHLDAQPGLPGYTVFGRVVDGWSVVEDIELVDTGIANGMAAVPSEPIVIQSVERIAP